MTLELLFYIFVTFFIRFFPRLVRPLKIDTDTWYHISSVDSIVRNKYKIPKCNFGFVLGGKYDYPFFAHWVASIFVGKNIVKYEKYISPLVDTIYISIGYFYIKYLVEFYQVNIENLELKYFLLGIFSISMIKISTGPRIYSFTPRIFGELFIFVFFISLHIYFITENNYFLLIAIIFSAFALNTSTFGSQVLALGSLILSVILFSFIPFISFLISLLVAYLISFGHYKNILKQQLKYSSQYARYGQFNHPAVKNRNKLKQYKKLFSLLINEKYKEAYGLFMSDLTFFNVFYKNVDILLGFILIFFINIDDSFLISLFISFFIIFLLTSFKPFLFLGESDRYLDYLVIFTIFILLVSLPDDYLYIFVVLEFLLFLITLLIYFKSSSNYGKNFIETMIYIKQNILKKDDFVIHGILGIYINYPLSVLTDIKSLSIETNYVFDLAMNKKLMPSDKFYTNDFDYLYNEYRVNIIVANKKYLNKEIEYDFSKFDVFYENKQYIVYKRKENL